MREVFCEKRWPIVFWSENSAILGEFQGVPGEFTKTHDFPPACLHNQIDQFYYRTKMSPTSLERAFYPKRKEIGYLGKIQFQFNNTNKSLENVQL